MRQFSNTPNYLVLLLCAMFSAQGYANEKEIAPTIKPLGICPSAEILVTEAYEHWSESTRLLAEAKSDIDAQKKLARIAKKLGQSYVLSQILTRKQTILSQMGEPASVDLGFRAQKLVADLTRIRDRSDSKVYRHLTGPAKTKYDNERPQIIQQIQKISRLYNNSKFIEAEKLLNQLIDEVNAYGFFLAPKWRQSLYTQIMGVGGRVQKKIEQIRLSEFRTSLNDKFESEFTSTDKLSENFQSCIQKIAKNGSATLAGKNIRGPELLNVFVKEHLKANIKLLRCSAIAASLNDRNLAERTSKAMAGLKTQLIEKSTRLIEVDANRASIDDVPDLYLGYLQSLMSIADSVDSHEIVFACEKPLMCMVAMSPGFAEEVHTYKDATTDLLYWRAKLANAQRENLLEHYPKVNKLLTNQLSTTGSSRRVSLNMVEFSKDKVPTVLETPLNEMQPAADDRLPGNHVLLETIVFNGTSMSPGLQHRNWVTVAQDVDLSEQIEGLKADLFASSENSPLSIEAAFSLATAVLNSYQEIGGKIKETELESAVNRFAKMPLNAGALVPIGQEFCRVELNQLITKLKVEADWIKHQHFFIALDQPEPSSK